METVVYPAIAERVMAEQAKRADEFNQSHKIIEELQPGTFVMIKDVLRKSKWTPYYDGPFEIIRRNQGGAYLLKDSLNNQLPFRVPINHMKLAPFATQSIEARFVVKKNPKTS